MASQNSMMHANGVFYIITANFLAIDYLPHIAIRVILILTNTINKVIVSGNEGYNNFYAAFAASILLIFFFEIIIYSNRKSNCRIFMELKVMALQ